MPPAICLGSRNHFAPNERSQQFLAVLINVYCHLKKTNLFEKTPPSHFPGKIFFPTLSLFPLRSRRSATLPISSRCGRAGAQPSRFLRCGRAGVQPSRSPMRISRHGLLLSAVLRIYYCHTRVSAAQHQLIGDTPPCFLKFSKLFSFFPSFLSFMHKKPP